jgi:hypothetical protein
LLHEQAPRKCKNFAEIHAAPQRMWRRLVKTMITDGWTVEETHRQMATIRQSMGPRPPLPADRTDDHVSIEQWRKLAPAAQRALLQPDLGGRSAPSFNRQVGPDIEWAMWSSRAQRDSHAVAVNPLDGVMDGKKSQYSKSASETARSLVHRQEHGRCRARGRRRRPTLARSRPVEHGRNIVTEVVTKTATETLLIVTQLS